ncbi:diacylglycerol kinase family lipid kinase [Sporosarcina sp. GW1-11]|uniref:diacylglycerol/lipid kinase family protein n=1 Tax=Sporosarcina sp. GW1-11 TaxID=2899126 RepID=UPI00294DF494|nr:diacylglycerol kinase family lipid kinase [Sporosarcina sp. GW1-11]MDV6378173.1 diacylglycerol kinase family lipid kinase [Sporosarcina sp. GW1-11]
MDVRFIINEQAGEGKGLVVWKELRAHSYPHEFTCFRGHATELARRAAQQHTNPLLLIIIGGDGTIHEVLNGIVGCTHVTVGVVKAGSGNDFARGVSTFRSLADIESYIEETSVKRKKVDLGYVQLSDQPTLYFAGSCGFGLDAEISLAVSQSKLKKTLNKWKLGSLVYVLTVVRSLLLFKPFDATIKIGNEERVFKDCWLITVSNQKYFGGGMKISPHSVNNDGKFELTVVHSIPVIKFLFVFLLVFTGGHTRFKGVSAYKGKKFVIDAAREVGCHTDGEYIGTTKIHQSVVCAVDLRKFFVADFD